MSATPPAIARPLATGCYYELHNDVAAEYSKSISCISKLQITDNGPDADGCLAKIAKIFAMILLLIPMAIIHALVSLYNKVTDCCGSTALPVAPAGTPPASGSATAAATATAASAILNPGAAPAPLPVSGTAPLPPRAASPQPAANAGAGTTPPRVPSPQPAANAGVGAPPERAASPQAQPAGNADARTTPTPSSKHSSRAASPAHSEHGADETKAPTPPPTGVQAAAKLTVDEAKEEVVA